MVHFLLQSGADVNIRTHYGQTPLDITSSPEVVKLLGGGAENLAEAAKKELPIVPNYLANPPFPYYDITREIETAKYGDAGTIAKTGLHKLNSRAHDNTTMPGRHDSSGDTPLAKHLASLTVLNDVTKQKSDVILSEAKGSTSWSSQAREEEQGSRRKGSTSWSSQAREEEQGSHRFPYCSHPQDSLLIFGGG